MNSTKVFVLLIVLCFAPNIFAAETSQSLIGRWNVVIHLGATQPGFEHRLMIVHNAMYNTLTFYDPEAVSDPPIDIPLRPKAQWTTANKETAISYAAYYSLIVLLPNYTAQYDAFMQTLGLDTQTIPTDISSPAGIGARVAKETLKFREDDGSNRLGNLNPTGIPYSEPILEPGYKPYKLVNTVDKLNDVNYWQPIRNPDGSVQTYYTHWENIRPFAVACGSEFRPKNGPKRTFTDYKGFVSEFRQIYNIVNDLTPKEKLIALYWEGRFEPTLNIWHAMVTRVALINNYGLDEEVKLFYALSQAIGDALVVSFDSKRHYNSVRPITAIHELFDPNWKTVITTPPHPDFTSAHAVVGATIAGVLQGFTGSDCFGDSYTDKESGITLSWETFSDAAFEAGMSRLYAGIHTNDAFRVGNWQGKHVGRVVWKKLKHLFGRKW